MAAFLYQLSSLVFKGKSPFLLFPLNYKLVNFHSMFSARSTAKLLPSQMKGQCRKLEKSAPTKHNNIAWTDQHQFLAVEHSAFQNQCVCYYSKKTKSKQKPVKRGVDSDDETDDEEEKVDSDVDDSEEEDEIDGAKKDWKDLKMNVPSLRIDAVLSSGLGVSRKKIEEAFLKAKLRHNGKKVMKKSRQVQEGDVLDVVKEDRITNKEGKLIMLVMRVEMKKIKEEKTPSDRTPVKLRRWKHLELPREK
ncbi:uncharacterized protein C6orf203 homolog [Strongylocentrotus purpuratus]|uniref:RNA-binding S4 domain-containing protein n=1 Tax=Strongylocentrotus purpuratus TaxID=7668 RepID=A0A7M7RHB7_STRPU|nr:uncharacterized protein C6orf203 homolog [Strongylocentrotus purpuratus]|eukprot:XP_798631.3 PREDICTED: uncharacterized protein C6orf203 homolog [Strongylocentrotus purpuratus]